MTVKREIKGYTFEISPLTFEAQRNLFMRLVQLFGEPVIVLLSGARNLDDLDIKSIAMGLVQGASSELVADLSDIFGEQTRYWPNSKPTNKPYLRKPDQEVLFGQIGLFAFFTWLQACLEVNYGPFVRELLQNLGAARATRTEPSTEP